MDELEYLRKVCETQDEFIKGNIGKQELERQLEILGLKFIAYLKEKNNSLMFSTAFEKQMQKILDLLRPSN